MNDFLFKLCSAIATEEGFFVPGTLPAKNNNPGDLRAAPWLTNPTIEKGFWHARSLPEGIAGLYHQVALDISRGWTLTQLISSWAPASDGNRTQQYILDVAKKVGIPANVPLQNYLTIEKI